MLEPNEGKLSRSVLRRGGESNLASLSRRVCSSAKTCEIDENLLCVFDSISKPREMLIHAGARVHPPLLQCQPVSSLHPYAAVERSATPVSPVPEPGRRSMGDVPLPTRVQTLLVQWLQAYLQRPHEHAVGPE